MAAQAPLACDRGRQAQPRAAFATGLKETGMLSALVLQAWKQAAYLLAKLSHHLGPTSPFSVQLFE
jgi:hypothetical protein